MLSSFPFTISLQSIKIEQFHLFVFRHFACTCPWFIMHRSHCKHVYFNGTDAQVWFKPIKIYRICFKEWWSWWWPKWCSIDYVQYFTQFTIISVAWTICDFWIFCSSCFFVLSNEKEKCKITIWMKCRFRRTLFKQIKRTANRMLTNKKTFWLS